MMKFEDRPQLPLSARRKLLVAGGGAMLAAQLAAALLLAPMTTGEANADPAALAALWGVSIPWSAAAALLLARHADTPDIATASFIVTISAFAAFALSTAFAARESRAEVDLVDALFFGVTSGALTSLIVWGIAQFTARLLRLPTSEGMHGAD